MSKYRILRDKGDGTPIKESSHGVFDNLMEAVNYLIIERIYLREDIKGRFVDLVDGKYAFTQIDEKTEDILPGTVVNGAIVQRGYIIHRSKYLVCRMWLEEVAG